MKANAIEKNNGDILGNIGISYLFLHDTIKANEYFIESLSVYDKYLEKDPCNIESLNGKGVVLAEINKFDESIECFDKIISLYKDDKDYEFVFASRNKGVALIKKGEFDKARLF